MFEPIDDGAAGHVTVTLDGVAVTADARESVAALLLRTPPHLARPPMAGGTAHAPFCQMGACFECLARVDGIRVRTCLVPVREGMVIERGGPEAQS
ncbi:(2Fe-2S)-binding protein [Acuticoccus mangrovi]|uniref:(2Fe-2S)-binding protein n=1 Tax=Acuticoccus mangrovi TaxID=2796142 RepID=A0A934IRY0_9HYPH|nr:(2Fe-2S)-binding protein [Acuticoccus mangrovi]MBJ3776559.1 (2Fe-2S)-binding protein [Acuticoccus mangrovi]